MDRCPCCNARRREHTVCSRCKADLKIIISIEKTAEYWFSQAIELNLSGNIEHCITAINHSLHLKKTTIAVNFQQFLIQQQCQYIIDLLAQKQQLLAKQHLYRLRMLFPHSNQLQQLNAFSDYLLATYEPTL